MEREHRADRAVTRAGRGVGIVTAVALAAAAGLAQRAVSQDFLAPGRDGAFFSSTSDFGGQDFGGVRFELATVRGPLKLSAARVFVWRSDSATGERVERLMLSGDARVTIGVYEFVAARAVVWLERLSDPLSQVNPEQFAALPAGAAAAGSDDAGVYQAFIYFDRVSSPTAGASVSVAADRLPVRAIIDVVGGIELSADVMREIEPADPLVAEGERELVRTLRRATGEEDNEPNPIARRLPRNPLPGEGRPFMPQTAEEARARADRALTEAAETLDTKIPGPIFARDGILTIAPGNVALVSGTEDSSVVISGGLVVQYTDPRSGRGLQLTAERGVIFLPPGPLENLTRLRAGDVRGLYLEGDVVASDGRYSLRGPRMYYDLQANRAVVLDAVFWTYDQQRKLPLYVRADEIRQLSAAEFSATNARLSTTAFFEPDFTIGAGTVTVTRREQVVANEPVESGWLSDFMGGRTLSGGGVGAGTEGGTLGSGMGSGTGGGLDTGLGSGGMRRVTTVDVDARDITLRGGNVPLFYWPQYSGPIGEPILRDIRLQNSSENGVAVRTRWNALPLLPLQDYRLLRPLTKADLLVDAYFERGLALGTDLAWRTEEGAGAFFGYGIFNDQGTDLLKPGTTIDRSGDNRGIALLEQRWRPDENWSITAEGSYISDAAFADAFFEDMAETRREFANRLMAERTRENTLLRAEAKASFNDFLANEYLLQTPGYSVEKLPELSYFRQADPFLDETYPGTFVWYQEWRAARLGLNLDNVEARERGFDTPRLSERAFGVAPTQTLAELLRGQGYFEDGVYRVDTRHEVEGRFDVGALRVTPFVVGRGTWYDNDFATFSPTVDENSRYWTSAGTTVSTTLMRVDNSVESRLLDLHRMRHIIEPSVTVWAAGTNIDRDKLPVYDETVEGIADGTALKAGLTQTWQTQRGGPREWRSVDVFKLNTHVVYNGDDAVREGPIGRFFEYRPELSNPGEYFTADGTWQVSDALALTGDSIYDLDLNQQARTSGGIIINHDPTFASFVDLRYINPLDSTYLDFGTQHILTSKYTLAWEASYDLDSAGFQALAAEVRRSFQSVTLGVNIAYNDISDETSFGFLVRPVTDQKSRRSKILSSEPSPDEVIVR